MNEEPKPEVNPDDLTKTTEPESSELTEEELNRVSGAVSFAYQSVEIAYERR